MRRFFPVIAVWLCAVGLSAQTPEKTGQATGQPASGAPVRAVTPFVDAHAHWEPADPEVAVESALAALKTENAAAIFLLPPPFSPDSPHPYDSDAMLPLVKKYPSRLHVLGGGGTLNVLIQQAVRSGDAGPEVQRGFRRRTEELLGEGVAGFGEMTAEHFQAATPYQHAPPDHPLFLLLADIAAQHDVPIVLHMEAVPTSMALPAGLSSPANPAELQANIAAFERLLAHNPRAHIIWAHAGADNTGYRTPELCRRLLAAHPNLFMEIKIDPQHPGKTPLLTGDGHIQPDWLRLFRDFPNRFIIGSDQHYPQPTSGQQRWEQPVLLLNQLPRALAEKIALENATRLYTRSRIADSAP